MTKYILYFLVFITLFISACDDDIIIGEDLVDDNEIGTASREDFDLSAITRYGDPIYTYKSGVIKQTFMTGLIDDPVFGKYSSDIYVAFRSTPNVSKPDFFDAVPDSIVLVLKYDTLGMYGDTAVSHTLDVFRVQEDYIDNDSIESSETFETSMMLLGSKTFIPSTRDSVSIISTSGDEIKVAPQLRIRLDDALAAEIFADSMAIENDTVLVENLKGLYLTARSNDKSMLGFNMTPSSISGLHLYYSSTVDTTRNVYSLIFRPEVFAHIEHDYSNAPVVDFIEDSEKGDSLIFTQSLQGLDPVITFPDLSDLKGNIINKATMTITVAQLDNDFSNEDFPLEAQLIGETYNEAGEKVYIEDILKFLPNDLISSTGTQVFNGRPVTNSIDGEDVIQYTLSITDFIDNIVKNDIIDAKLILSPLFREQSPRNAVLYGPNHSTYPINLRITYTEL